MKSEDLRVEIIKRYDNGQIDIEVNYKNGKEITNPL